MFRPTKVLDAKTPNKMAEEVNQNIQVFVRCRPLNKEEKKGQIEIIPDKRSIKTTQQNKVYSFDNVFDDNAKQLDVYRSVVEPLVEQVIEGYNCTVFAYGQTGTGKTYTMVGNRTDSEISWEDDPLSGIIPRAIDQLLDDLQHQNTEYSIRVSFLELYNEEAYDLLSPLSDTNKLRIFNDTERKGSVIISGLVELIVKTKAEIFEILEKGTLKRQTAPTLMNACSSRSHSIFSVTVHIKEITFDGEEVVKLGKLNLVDLAGSENIRRSGAVEERAREASNINKSLLTLGRVITSLVEKSPHIPYRDSKLTRLLQDSLGGKTKTSIIATISPCADDLEDTISTLDYAQRAKKITNKPEINQKMSKKTLLNEYANEIDRLRRELAASRDKNGIYVDAKNYAHMEATIVQQEQNLELKEAQIENMKRELDKYSILLSEVNENLENKCKELENTKEELEELSNDLKHTREVLKNAQEENEDSNAYIDALKKTEMKLLKKAQVIHNVTEKCVDDNQKLFNKVETYSSLENYNDDCIKQFKDIYNGHIKNIANINFLTLNTISSSCNSISDLIQDGKGKISNKNNELENKITDLETTFKNFGQLLRDSLNKDKEIIDKNADFEILFNNFKKTFFNEVVSFTNDLLKDKNAETVRILDELYKQSENNRSKLEENIMNQISQVNEFSKNITHVIQSIDDDFKRIHAQKCHENELLEKKISDLENMIQSNDTEQKLKEITQLLFQNLNVIASDHQEKMRSLSTNLKNCKSHLKTVAEKEAENKNHLSFKCKELAHLVTKDEKNFTSTLSNLDEQIGENCCSNLLKLEQFKKCLNEINSGGKQFQEKCQDNLDVLCTMMNQKSQSLRDLIISSSESKIELTQKFQKELSSLFQLSRTVSNDLSGQTQKTFDDALNEFKQLESYVPVMKTSQEIEMEDCKKVIRNLVDSYKKYQSTGVTPKRNPYYYPKSFTPTSPRENIVSRFRAQKQKLDFVEETADDDADQFDNAFATKTDSPDRTFDDDLASKDETNQYFDQNSENTMTMNETIINMQNKNITKLNDQTYVIVSFATWTESEGLRCKDDFRSIDDLPNYDFIHQFKYDLDSLPGSDLIQKAYQLQDGFLLTLASRDVFPEGLPKQFSFSCTFREPNDLKDAWNLFRIEDNMGNTQMKLKIQPNANNIELSLLDNLQTLIFDNVHLNERDWNKIDLSFYPDSISLYVNCKKQQTLPLEFDFSTVDIDGEIQLCNHENKSSTVPIDIQWMTINCDASRPVRDKCSGIKQTKVIVETTQIEPKCCQPNFPAEEIKSLILLVLKENLDYFASHFRGLPGKPGIPGKSNRGLPGLPGPKGEPGMPGERGFIGLPGVQGKTGSPGPKGDKGDNGDKGSKGDTGDTGPKGNTGRTGMRGPHGIQGPMGLKGERGLPGKPGQPGVRGPQGPTGRDGVCGCDLSNMHALQFILSQNQRHTKGPGK